MQWADRLSFIGAIDEWSFIGPVTLPRQFQCSKRYTFAYVAFHARYLVVHSTPQTQWRYSQFTCSGFHRPWSVTGPAVVGSIRRDKPRQHYPNQTPKLPCYRHFCSRLIYIGWRPATVETKWTSMFVSMHFYKQALVNADGITMHNPSNNWRHSSSHRLH